MFKLSELLEDEKKWAETGEALIAKILEKRETGRENPGFCMLTLSKYLVDL